MRAEEVREAYQDCPEYCRRQPRGELAVSEEEEHGGNAVVLEWAMGKGVVLVAEALGQAEAVVQVQTFVVTYGPCAKVPESHGRGHQNQQRVRCHLPVGSQQGEQAPLLLVHRGDAGLLHNGSVTLVHGILSRPRSRTPIHRFAGTWRVRPSHRRPSREGLPPRTERRTPSGGALPPKHRVWCRWF